MRARLATAGVALFAAAAVACLLPGAEAPRATGAGSLVAVERPDRSAAEAALLTGRVIVLDPGHQLGNRDFPRKINRLVPAGGFRKTCNTTGAATDAGYPEATFTWQVARLVQRRLVALGARVVLTRDRNSTRLWGPCVDARGRAGNRIDADLKLSIHADGSRRPGARGFHVIAPADRPRWTRDIVRPSRRLALDLRAALVAVGFARANYAAGGDGLDVRGDLATLNLSDVPAAMVELGNMRNPREARRMSSPAGRAAYADALVRGVLRFLG